MKKKKKKQLALIFVLIALASGIMIPDFQGRIVGMLYVGILETKVTVLKERLILLFMFGMLVSVAISSFLSLKILKKEFWENIQSGQKQ